MMLRECVRLAREEQRIVIFVEPIALYPTRDLHREKDGIWMQRYPPVNERIPLGDVGVHGDGTDLAIITYGNGRYLSTQAQEDLETRGIRTRVIDMRWLAPLPAEAILTASKGCKNVLIVDECRSTGSQSEALMTMFVENDINAIARHVAGDCFIATGPAYAASLPSKHSIISAALALVAGDK